ncbi:MAG: universal stress protein [Methanobacterium sp.]|jgi:nucleotide-binding universal stress UspA family protein
MYKKILFPTDGSKCANKALKHAIWIAGLSGAEIIALNVIETSPLIGVEITPVISSGEDPRVQIKELLKEEGLKALEKVSKLVEESKTENECHEEITLTMVTEEGYPEDTIVKKIKEEDIDLVVMGKSGKHVLDRFLLGSVTEKVVRSATCPVLVVR